ncbi:MAG TPA: hypothetical protein VFK80_08290, partial [Limnochordia bacterium]|nr:hypothetical protein [Limnochordia bacterium]
LIAMDGAGRLAAGSLETGARRGDDPYLVQDDPAALWAGAVQALATHRLVVVELGDLARLANAELSIAPAVAERARAGALQRLDAFVGAWLAGAQPGDRLLVVSPNPAPGDAARGHTLTAALWVEAGRDLHAALLTSATTHRAGLIANIDVAPTVLTRFGLVPPLNMAGAPIRITAGGNALAHLQRQYALIAATHDASPPVLKSYVLVAIAVFLFCGFWLGLAGFGRLRPPGPGARRLLRGLLLGVQAFPLVLLLLPLTGPHPPWLDGLLAAAGALALAGLGLLWGRGMAPFGWLALLTALALMIDVAMGSRLMRFAILGYDAMGGARYYGIGNEFMGVLLGSAVAACAILHVRRPRMAQLLGVIGFAAVTVWLGSSGLGANVGGAISAVVGLPLTLMLLARVRIRWPAVVAILLAVPLLLALAAWADLSLHPADPSHLGRLAQRMAREGFSPLWHIGGRKIALNLKLVRWTIWTRIFAVSLGAVIWLFTRPQAARPGATVLAPSLRRGVLGAFLVSLVAFAANDSGIVAAATTMLPATVMLFAGLLTGGGEADRV